jgi:hypothetical protein
MEGKPRLKVLQTRNRGGCTCICELLTLTIQSPASVWVRFFPNRVVCTTELIPPSGLSSMHHRSVTIGARLHLIYQGIGSRTRNPLVSVYTISETLR